MSKCEQDHESKWPHIPTSVSVSYTHTYFQRSKMKIKKKKKKKNTSNRNKITATKQKKDFNTFKICRKVNRTTNPNGLILPLASAFLIPTRFPAQQNEKEKQKEKHKQQEQNNNNQTKNKTLSPLKYVEK